MLRYITNHITLWYYNSLNMRGNRKRDGFAVRIRLPCCPNPAGHSRRLNTGHPIFSKTVSYFLQSLFWMFIEVSLGRANGRFPIRLCSCKTCPHVPPSFKRPQQLYFISGSFTAHHQIHRRVITSRVVRQHLPIHGVQYSTRRGHVHIKDPNKPSGVSVWDSTSRYGWEFWIFPCHLRILGLSMSLSKLDTGLFCLKQRQQLAP